MDDYSLVIPGGEECYDQAIDMLSETNWDGQQLKEIAPGRERMYSYFGITVPPKPAAVAKPGDVEMIQT